MRKSHKTGHLDFLQALILVDPFASMTNSPDIPHPGSIRALFGLAEREQKPFGPCGLLGTRQPAAELNSHRKHTPTHANMPCTQSLNAISLMYGQI